MIRPFRPEDLETIADIGNRAWRDIYTSYRNTLGDDLVDRYIPNEYTRKGEEIRTSCAEHPEWVLICEEDGKVVGFITFTLDESSRIGVIGNNGVDPECRSKGLGQQMYSAVLDLFKEKGMLYARVQTGLDDGHARARKAYERAGFDTRLPFVNYFKKL